MNEPKIFRINFHVQKSGITNSVTASVDIHAESTSDAAIAFRALYLNPAIEIWSVDEVEQSAEVKR